jgi:NAD(P)-dependent dehydrogenase (short-subunit alcohol dehydrogenase family)
VVLLGRKVPKLNRVYDAIAKAPGEALPEPLNYPLDLAGATPEDFATLAARIDAQVGRLDGVLHCAADFDGLTPLEHTDPVVFARALHVDVTARWWLTQACLPLLRRAPDAGVVFVLDDAPASPAYRGGYGVAQHAQAGLVAMLAAELASSSVRVSGLRPGPMRTPLRAKAYVEDGDGLARDPAVYADACVELLSPAGQARRGTLWAPVP